MWQIGLSVRHSRSGCQLVFTSEFSDLGGEQGMRNKINIRADSNIKQAKLNRRLSRVSNSLRFSTYFPIVDTFALTQCHRIMCNRFNLSAARSSQRRAREIKLAPFSNRPAGRSKQSGACSFVRSFFLLSLSLSSPILCVTQGIIFEAVQTSLSLALPSSSLLEAHWSGQ